VLLDINLTDSSALDLPREIKLCDRRTAVIDDHGLDTVRKRGRGDARRRRRFHR
jgi:hypothetical protein